MKVLLSGASGFVGSHLRQELEVAGHQVKSLGRGPRADYGWSDEALREGVNATDGIIHLAGENLFAKRWSKKQKHILRKSRIESTRRLAKLAARFDKAFMINASAVGYYGACGQEPLGEDAPQGTGFVAQLCADWEAAADPARSAGVRVACIRIGVVLGNGGGALQRMLTPFRLGLGGPIGSGQQSFPWIHIEDLARLFRFLLESPEATGAYNGTAPNGLPMGEFAKLLGKQLKRPAVLPMPAFALRLLLGEAAKILLTGQRHVPNRALESGFQFNFTQLEPALEDLLRAKDSSKS